jgi:hypothetical protein
MKITHREAVLARALNWDYFLTCQRKREWLDLPSFVRKHKSFSIQLELLLDA